MVPSIPSYSVYRAEQLFIENLQALFRPYVLFYSNVTTVLGDEYCDSHFSTREVK